MWYPSRRPALVPSGGSPLASTCSMSSPYALTLRPVISSLMLGCVPLSACLGSCLSSASPRHRYLSRCRYHPIASRLSPRLIDTTGGEIRRCCGGSLGFACLPLARHLIHAVRHRMATGLGACLVRLPLPASVSGSSSSAPPANPIARSIRFPRRPTVPSPHLPDRSTRGTGRWSICAGFVYCGGGGCLACLGVVLFILSMGDVVARRFVSGL